MPLNAFSIVLGGFKHALNWRPVPRRLIVVRRHGRFPFVHTLQQSVIRLHSAIS